MNRALRNILSWTIYPAVMAVSLGLYYGLVACGAGFTVSSYAAAILGGFGLVTLLEKILPYRTEWVPRAAEIKTDIVFLILVQMLLPQLLTLLATVALADTAHQQGWYVRGLWPQDWPTWAQMLLLLFIGDFLFYWLHRAMHTWTPLWRFHAVHHSVQKLYGGTVGRFHPIDKALQFFFCDSLPFIFLGVSKEVFTLYFVVFAIKGFFQHGNVDVRLGWFNFLISGPELHRWHHSKASRESNRNYGNNVIIWDILFRTYFLPKDRTVGDLGLLNRNYPMRFWQQIRAPFIKNLDKAQ